MKTKELKKLKRSGKQGSLNAQAVANDVIDIVEKGGKVIMSKILRKRGYFKAVIKNPDRVTKQSTYIETIDPFVAKMLKERDEALKRMAKIRNKAKYRDLTDAIDKLTKNAQLLSGKDTEKHTHEHVVQIPARK